MKLAVVGEFPPAAFQQMTDALSQRPDLFELEIVDTKEKMQALTDAECVVMRIFKLETEDILRNPNLKFVQKWGAGFDTVDIETAGKRGIPVANTPGANAFSVAEQTLLLILNVYRNYVAHYEHLKKGVWTKAKFMERTYSLKGKLVGLVGCGNVGREVAKRVQAFGARVCYYDLYRMSEEREQELELTYMPFEELIEKADVVSVHLPLNEKTKNLIGRDELNRMKPTAVLINTARGGIVDEQALCEALHNKRILGAGLDCMEHEPPREDDPILHAPNITLSPHVGGISVDLTEVIVPMMVENLIRFAETGKAEYVVNREFLQM